jgi:predicted transport protein
MPAVGLSPRQEKWFASVQASLAKNTGKTLEQWVEIAKTCPETAHRARLAWFKAEHGLLQNYASHVLAEAFGGGMAWADEDALVDALWTDPAKRAIFDAVREAALALPDVVMGPRKSYTAFSRKIQFAAARPDKKGGIVLGVNLPLDADPRLLPRAKSESWAEKLVSLPIADVAGVDDRVRVLLKQAWERC